MPTSRQSEREPLAIYLHWPYCARICPYCDFNVYKQRTDDSLVGAIRADLSQWRDLTGPRQVTSIHFGGGTPSLLPAGDIAQILREISDLWDVAAPVETALEANPADADAEKWAGYAAAGINRLSLGVQSFHDPALKQLGRDHDGAMATRAVTLAMEVFPSISADLIFGWAGQSEAQLDRDLDVLLTSGVPHISTYQLTVEPGTAFARAEARGLARSVDVDQSAGLYDRVRDRLIAAGFDHYEVSNFAKPHHRSQHNLAYWRGVDYVGVGPGAHGRVTVAGERRATVAHLRPDAYTEAVAASGSGIETTEILSPDGWAEEYVLMGLRIDEGISLQRYAQIAGRSLDSEEMTALIADGYLAQAGDRFYATAAGRMVLNAVTERLLLG
jgi:oxygen-independent coproporphyrinogen-3 oxidase